jgi:hypothetical protein
VCVCVCECGVRVRKCVCVHVRVHVCTYVKLWVAAARDGIDLRLGDLRHEQCVSEGDCMLCVCTHVCMSNSKAGSVCARV